ncbi:hypothetical protein [Neobacillus sp. Marseille-QA0830]
MRKLYPTVFLPHTRYQVKMDRDHNHYACE